MLYRRPGSLTESKCWDDRLAKDAGSDPSGTLSEETEGRNYLLHLLHGAESFLRS